MKNRTRLTENGNSLQFESRGAVLTFDRISGSFTSITYDEMRLEANDLPECVFLLGGETVSSAQGIVTNARALQEMTNHILDKFDAYMAGINQVREHDENYEKRVAELLNRMQQENKDLAELLASLGNNIRYLKDGPVQVNAELSADPALAEIHTVLSSMKDNIGTISTTLSALAEEA